MSGSVLNSFGQTIFKLGYQISPIIFVGGIASGGIAGGFGYLPIVAITEAANFVIGLLSGGTDLSLDDFFAHFSPLPGSSLIDNAIGKYPFANQTIAANAIITQPLKVSMLMRCPVRDSGGYTTKLITMTALQYAMAQHNSLGGTYIVATPSYLYQNMIQTGMRDVSTGDTKQSQTAWQLDFEQPLITLAAAAGAQNSLMNQISNGLPTSGAQSGAGVTGAAGSIPSASTNLVGTSVAAPPIVPVTSAPL